MGAGIKYFLDPPPNKQLRHFKYPRAAAVKSCAFYRHFMVNIFLVPKMMKPFLMGWRGLFYGTRPYKDS